MVTMARGALKGTPLTSDAAVLGGMEGHFGMRDGWNRDGTGGDVCH